jgi:acetyl esterase/lipase
MGYPSADLIGLGALRLHRDLGFNVAMPTLPLHGPRRVTRISGEAMLSFDLIDSLHGLAQAVWDVRRVISWVRTQSPTGIVLGGVSLGGYLAALVAGIEPDLDGVIAGVPVVDFPALFHAHSPTNIRLRSIEHEILGGNAETVHQVVQPCSFPALVPQDRRFVFAGTGDRMATAMQAHQLWRHWEGPEMCWYAGNHVGYLWAPEVRRFVGTALRNTLPEALPAP